MWPFFTITVFTIYRGPALSTEAKAQILFLVVQMKLNRNDMS